MSNFIKKNIKEINENFTELIGQKWMLITAEKNGKSNTMTASWGGIGVLWGKEVSFVFIRPSRYTYEFVESSQYYTLSFFDDKYKDKLSYLGKVSGRDEDKISAMGLTVVNDGEFSYFEEANMVIVCKKIYKDDIETERFIDKEFAKSVYPTEDIHKMFIGEIQYVLKK